MQLSFEELQAAQHAADDGNCPRYLTSFESVLGVGTLPKMLFCPGYLLKAVGRGGDSANLVLKELLKVP